MSRSIQIAAAVTDKNLELVLKVLPAIVVIMAASWACGRLALMVKQPRVLGEMVAGVLLGPTLLGAVWADGQKFIFPPEVKPILYVLSTIGLTLFMFLVGVGFDHSGGTNGKQEARRAGLLAVSGMVPSLLLGGAVGWLTYDSLSKPGVGSVEFMLFLGGALSITAFPMLARILYERNLQNTSLGRMTLLGASFDDAAAWCFLAVISAMHANAGGAKALVTIGLSVAFVAVMLLVVRPLLKPLGERVQRTGEFGLDQMYLVLGVVIAAGFFTDYIGIYSVFGGFVAGLAMPNNPAFREAVLKRMMDVTTTLLLPIFFTFSGLNTQLNGLGGWAMIGPFLLILVAGFIGKYFGCGLALRGAGLSWRKSLAIGGLMNARGLMILIFINIGLAQGIIGQEVFSMLVLVAVVTTALALPLYRWAMPDHVEREMLIEEGVLVEQAPEPRGDQRELVGSAG
ncbi:cation:proton antiporter [Streptomyces sp. NPDC127584]|uniref:cation:proton antiporter domain-containing protein n=1 Tax=Streptomyces sp. NPDC127584 TaxID=3345403 RepID=UPI003641BF59